MLIWQKEKKIQIFDAAVIHFPFCLLFSLIAVKFLMI